MGCDVLVLETGYSDPDMDVTRSIHTSSALGGATLRFGFSRQLGGSSNLWAGRVAPFEAADFWEKMSKPLGGWPFGLDELHPYYAKAAGILNIPYEALWPTSKPDSPLNTPGDFGNVFSGGTLDVKKFFWNKPPFNTGNYLKAAAKNNECLRVFLGAHVRHLEQDKDTGRVISARVASPAKRELKIKASFFVLAAGGLETPRIMLNSRSVSAQGIGNQNDMVGRCLVTHPKADLGVLVLKKREPTHHPLFNDSAMANGQVRYGLGLSQSGAVPENALNHYVQLSPLLEYRLNNFFDKAKGNSLLASPFIDRSKFLRGFLPSLGLMAYETIGRLAGIQRSARLFVLRAFLDQYPSLENRVSLSSQLDFYGDNKIDIAWKLTEEDKFSVRQFISVLDKEIQKLGLGTVESLLPEMDEWPLIGIHSHFIGTTRMGHDPKTSVVDENCAVHGVPNLFISGPSVFSTGGYANPFFTISALSLRLAKHLRQRLEMK